MSSTSVPVHPWQLVSFIQQHKRRPLPPHPNQMSLFVSSFRHSIPESPQNRSFSLTSHLQLRLYFSPLSFAPRGPTRTRKLPAPIVILEGAGHQKPWPWLATKMTWGACARGTKYSVAQRLSYITSVMLMKCM